MTKNDNIKFLYYCYTHGNAYTTVQTYSKLMNDIVRDIFNLPESKREMEVLPLIESHVGILNAISQPFYFKVFQTLIEKHVIKKQTSFLDLYTNLKIAILSI